MKVLVGLGNPGSKYENNRHNVGFMAIDAIARRYGAGQWRQRYHGQAVEVDINRVRYLLLKPMTYMNESGRAVGEAMRFYKISPADVIVFHDELDLEPGKVRVKFGGGHAGHNGLKSITAHIGNDYQRVRIGIGHPGQRELVSPYVLSDFAKADRDWLEPLLDAMASSLSHLVAGDDPKFLNEVARILRPVPVVRKADPAGERQPVEAASESAPTKSDPVSAAPVEAAPVEEPRPAVSAPEAVSAPIAAAPVEPQPAPREPEPVAPAPAAAAAKPAPSPDPVPPVREKEPAMAGGDDYGAEIARAQGLATKLRKWFVRG